MNTKEKNKQLEEARMRKINMKIFPICNMLGTDFVFYYAT